MGYADNLSGCCLLKNKLNGVMRIAESHRALQLKQSQYSANIGLRINKMHYLETSSCVATKSQREPFMACISESEKVSLTMISMWLKKDMQRPDMFL